MDTNVAARAPRELIICFLDLSAYTMDARRTADDGRLAGIIDDYYERLAEGTRGAGGTVVKFIGDGALLVFPTTHADEAIAALLGLKARTDAWMADLGWDSRLVVKAHAGKVVAGAFGASDDKRFDVLGDEVNVAARLQTRTFAISAQAFRLLSPEARKRFKKHTPPITYIRIEEKHAANVAHVAK